MSSHISKYPINKVKIGVNSFPHRLKHIPQPPQFLYYRGDASLLAQDCLSIVGTRKISSYGRQVCHKLVGKLSQYLVIVSGLALGVDGLTHKICADKRRPNIAVLPGGLDDESIYPPTHYSLAQQILRAGGLLISEYPASTSVRKYHFLQRNRIIAGLSVGTLVIECPAKSGALITARYALEQNRNVYSVPGPITQSNNEGTNDLIKQGAQVVTCYEDILQDLGIPTSLPVSAKLDQSQQILVDLIQRGYNSLDTITSNSPYSVSKTLSELSRMEMDNLIKNVSGLYTIM